jgi:phage shock protein E
MSRTSRLALVLSLVGLLALLLAACGSGAAAPAAPAAAATAAPAAAQIDPASLPVNIDVAQAAALLNNPNVVFVDVREQSEYDAGHIPGVKLIPLGSVASRLSEIPKDKQVVAVCHSGNRSSQATALLQQQGFTNIHNMLGGMTAWTQAGNPVER